jgi:hypothetical protein
MFSLVKNDRSTVILFEWGSIESCTRIENLNQVKSVFIASDLSFVLITEAHSISQYDPRTGVKLKSFSPGDGQFRTSSVSRNDRIAAVTFINSQYLTLLNLDDFSTIAELDIGFTSSYGERYFFNSDTTLLYYSGTHSLVFNLLTLKREYIPLSDIHRIRPNDTITGTTEGDDSVVYDHRTKTTTEIDYDSVTAVFSCDDRLRIEREYVNSSSQRVNVFDAKTNTVLKSIEPGVVPNCLTSPNSDILLMVVAENAIRCQLMYLDLISFEITPILNSDHFYTISHVFTSLPYTGVVLM